MFAEFGLIIRATVDAGLDYVDMKSEGGLWPLYHGMMQLERYTETDLVTGKDHVAAYPVATCTDWVEFIIGFASGGSTYHADTVP